MTWRLENICIQQKDRVIVQPSSLEINPGKLTVLLGPNGAGKTTLLRGALGMIPTRTGRSWLDDQELSDLPATLRARKLAYLPQKRTLAWPLAVHDTVALSRFAYGGVPGKLAAADAAAVSRAMALCELTDLANQAADTLSGGEEARMHLARGLAAETPWLIADEPTAGLDPRHQHQIMQLLQNTTKAGKSIVLVLHDLNLTARYADEVILMDQGSIIEHGPASSVLRSDLLSEVYGIPMAVKGLTIEVQPAG